jgi:hypothetical protein
MTNLPMRREDDYIIEAAKMSVGFGRILTFNKGEYFLDKVEVSLGTKFRAHTREWVKVWINFQERPIVQKIYRIALGQEPPDRKTLGYLDRSEWEPGFDGNPKDPWALQFIVPFESLETGEIVAFRTPSKGGQRAVSELCSMCAFRSKRGELSVPIIALATTSFPTKNFGKVHKPQFDIAGWDEDAGVHHEMMPEQLGGAAAALARDPIDDEIPY